MLPRETLLKPLPVKKESKAPSAKREKIADPGPMKKDGTPDKRFKQNKIDAAAKSGPMKKDGTPDMRYKQNKMKEAKKMTK